MKVANIISKNPVKVPEEFNVVESMDEIIHGLPTLIVGFDYVNKHYPDFDITEYKVSENLYWIFKKTEKRDKHEEGLTWFIKKVYSEMMSDVKYIFVDAIQYGKKPISKIIRKILSIEKKYFYFDGNMLFIYGDNYIFGVDFVQLKYIGVNVESLKEQIKKRKKFFICNDSKYLSTIKSLENEPHKIPFMFYLRNEK